MMTPKTATSQSAITLTINWLDYLISYSVGLGAFLCYLRTLAPGLLPGDSAEFQTLAFTLGMTHPTGYPVYLLFGKLFTLLPFGEIPFRINLLSAVCAATTVALVYLIARRLTGHRIAPLLGATSLSLAGIFWSQAVVAELYTPAAMLLAAVVLALITWRQTEKPIYLFLAGLVGGISIGVHNTVTLLAPAVLLYLLLTARRSADWRAAIGGAVLGLTLWFTAFLIIDARDIPTSFYNSVVQTALSGWGLAPSEFDTPIERLIYLLGARQFRGQMFNSPWDQFMQSTSNYWRALQMDFSPLALLLAIIGVVTAFRRTNQEIQPDWREALLLLAGLVAILGFVLNYDITDIHVFYIPSYVLLSIYCSSGVAIVSELVRGLLSRQTELRERLSVVMAGSTSLLLAAVIILPKAPETYRHLQALAYTRQNSQGAPINQWANADRIQYIATHALARMEDDAILFTTWIDLYIYYYLAHIEGGRTGMSFHEIYPHGTDRRMTESARNYIRENIHQRPIYFSMPVPELRQEYKLQPIGEGLFRLEIK